jgi:hypothetical protein
MILRFQPTDTPMKLRAEANYERSEASRKIGFGTSARRTGDSRSGTST